MKQTTALSTIEEIEDRVKHTNSTVLQIDSLSNGNYTVIFTDGTQAEIDEETKRHLLAQND